MKAETYFLCSTFIRETLKKRLDEFDLTGLIKITISDKKDKSARCRGLQWRWYTDVANSGMGSYDTKEDVHRAAKWRWAVPILKRDSDSFSKLYAGLFKEHGEDKEIMRYIMDEFVSTESEGFAIGEYLTEFEQYYRGHGVPLTVPDDGLLEWAKTQENKTN
jgi:hypothetical protein